MPVDPAVLIRDLIAREPQVRICALGSSNTQRRLMGMHWFDYIELGLKTQFGKGSVLCCNMGVGGENSQHLLDRFDRDCGRFEPHLAIITCGGNDAHPDHNISEQAFSDNMHELYRRFSAMGTAVIFQTYYGCDLENLDPEYAATLVKYMQTVRQTAADCDAYVQENFARWEPLRQQDVQLYRALMTDRLHVNDLGNALLGLDWLRTFKLDIPDMISKAVPGAFFARKTLDLLNQQ